MKSIKSKAGFILMLGTTLALGAYPATRAFCQDSAAGQQMHQSGQDIKGAGSDTVDSAEHAATGVPAENGSDVDERLRSHRVPICQ